MIVENSAFLPITLVLFLLFHIFTVLVVPRLTKKLLSISKLTYDFSLSVIFTNNFLTIQNRQIGRVVTIGKRDGGLYMLGCDNSAFISILRNKSLHASYDLWHARLSHVNYSIISFLNKKGHLSLLCLYSLHHVVLVSLQKVIDSLIFVVNVGRLIKSNSDFLYYVIFIDDYSPFTCIYPLKFKYDFFDIFFQFKKFGKNQYYARIKVFKVMEVLNLLALVSNLTYILLTSTIKSLVHIHLLKMVVLRENVFM